ncbi:MAG TPA: hypothetical protein VNM90_15730 [Haliangium sp.]|nr:hypothetical protein [Haliangium sp.]
MALEGDTAVIGAPGDRNGGVTYLDAGKGAAYVFARSGGSWSQQQKLMAGADAAFNARVGHSVALSGDTALIGSPGNEAAFVFVRSGTTWTQQQTLTASNTVSFGCSVALSGETALVGAEGDSVNLNNNYLQGAAFVYVRTGTVWNLQEKLLAADGTENDRLGSAVALEGDTALVGARGDEGFKGAAYVFVRPGVAWAQQGPKLTAGVAGQPQDYFGAAVAISGDGALIGAHGDASHQGAAYLFVRTGGTWNFQRKFVSPNGQIIDSFGYSVALSGDMALVGAPTSRIDGKNVQGAAHLFQLD